MKLILSFLAALSLCGCAGSYRDGSLENSDHFGRANTANITAQADAARSDQNATDADRMVNAVEKYKNGNLAPTNAPAASQIGQGH